MWLIIFDHFQIRKFIRDHSMSAKKLVGGVRRWLFLLIYSTIYADIGGWVDLKKPKTCLRNTWMVPNQGSASKQKDWTLVIHKCYGSKNLNILQHNWTNTTIHLRRNVINVNRKHLKRIGVKTLHPFDVLFIDSMGSFNNYVDQILPNFDHLLPSRGQQRTF